MSIPFSGTISKSGGLTSAISKQLRSVTLKPVKKVQIKFDPFHPKVEQTRYFLYYLSTKKVQQTNLNCSIKTQVLCDRTDPSITFGLANGEEVVFNSANLSALEMLKLYNQHITVLAPKEEPAVIVTTKSAKKTLNKRR